MTRSAIHTTWPTASGLLLLAVALVGCQSTYGNQTTAEHGVVAGRTTRIELYEVLGAPNAFSKKPDGTDLLVYNHVKTRGMKAGVAILFTPFSLGNSRSRTDTLFVEMGDDDVVINVEQIGGQASPGWSIWPFGKGSGG